MTKLENAVIVECWVRSTLALKTMNDLKKKMLENNEKIHQEFFDAFLEIEASEKWLNLLVADQADK